MEATKGKATIKDLKKSISRVEELGFCLRVVVSWKVCFELVRSGQYRKRMENESRRDSHIYTILWQEVGVCKERRGVQVRSVLLTCRPPRREKTSSFLCLFRSRPWDLV